MKKLATMAAIPLFAGFLCAQSQTETTTTTTKTNYEGTLVDAGFRTTHTESNRSETSKPDENTTRTQTTNTKTDSTECPVTQQTSAFGLMTSDGKFVRFDDPSNTRIIEMVKKNKGWSQSMSDQKPIRVRVVGTPHGDVVVLDSIR